MSSPSNTQELNNEDPLNVELIVVTQEPSIELIEVGLQGPPGTSISDDSAWISAVDNSKLSPITSIIRINDSQGEQTLIQDVVYADWRGYTNHSLFITYDSFDRTNIVKREFDLEGFHYIYEFQLLWDMNDQVASKLVITAAKI